MLPSFPSPLLSFYPPSLPPPFLSPPLPPPSLLLPLPFFLLSFSLPPFSFSPHPLLSLSSPFLLPPLPSSPPPSVFPMDCLPIDSYCICTSLFIIPPPSHPLLLVPSIFGGEV